MLDIQLRPFQPGDEIAFRKLNEDWINKYFALEPSDRLVLENPVKEILEPGGHIFMAHRDGVPVGCCALLPMEQDSFELAKMTVAEEYRGQGIGREILQYAVAQAKALGATRLFLGSNSRLANAIHLYESIGFRHVPPERLAPTHYARANVFMEIFF